MATVFLLPGWLDSAAGHWQSRWQARYGDTRVHQHDWQRPLRGDWTARLQEVLVNHAASAANTTDSLLNSELLTPLNKGPETDLIENPRASDAAMPAGAQRSVVLVAHSLGCHLVAAWAAASPHTAVVRAALLVAPPDLTRDDLPPDLYNWRKPVLGALPFPATCVISSNDPFASLVAGRAMASVWGARCVEAGALGHINGDSGLGDWPAGRAMLVDLAGSQI